MLIPLPDTVIHPLKVDASHVLPTLLRQTESRAVGGKFLKMNSLPTDSGEVVRHGVVETRYFEKVGRVICGGLK
ncbi:hypothetical protein CEXT_570511 [Caerostris extrusa]|uniref:Uncharacterized protein n=1 Tax=Caerostris extrusa TaxID=172846 RepID=A0AAV4N2R0_CAEEX|nr:hypothetical protein CEXT_570511 [Caerostris extrusa]